MDAVAGSFGGDMSIAFVALLGCATLLLQPPLIRQPRRIAENDIGQQRRVAPSDLGVGDVADLALLLAVGLLAGLSVSLTCRQIARTVDSPAALRLRTAVERQQRGQPLLEALDQVLLAQPLHHHTRRSPQEAPLGRILALLRSQIEDGAAVADALLELSTSVRDDARRQAETRARRLPVRMLLPLIVCVLPGFLLLTVAPVIIESLRGISA